MICRIKVSFVLNMRSYHMETLLDLIPYLKFTSEAAVRAQMVINTF